MTTFTDLKLNENILSALKNKGYETPTPIQAGAIPHIIENKDFLGIAQTGTGKTAAFSLPILHNLAKNPQKIAKNQVRTLILTPTRELASQIADNIELYGQGLGLKHIVIFGGVNINPQITKMQEGQDIVIATPGRLLDLMGRNCVDLSKIEVFVLDEADRMLDMGFIIDVKRIIARLPAKRQTLFFSATMPPSISSLADKILKDPMRVEITPQATTVEKIEQKVNFVEKASKPELLKHILEQPEAKSVLVFANTKQNADRIFSYLNNNGIKTAAIHGDKTQSQREQALNDLRENKVQVLIATDIAARGIDISGISHVINYDIPQDPESYVHRIGRTARAGREGVAISFCDFAQKHLLHMIEGTIKYKIPVDEEHPFHGVKNALAPKEFGGGRLLSRAPSQKAAKTEDSAEKKAPVRKFARKISSSKPDSGDKKPVSKNLDRKPARKPERDSGKSRNRNSDKKPKQERRPHKKQKPTFLQKIKKALTSLFKKEEKPKNRRNYKGKGRGKGGKRTPNRRNPKNQRRNTPRKRS